MTKTAFLFPGQGSQAIGMGVQLVAPFRDVCDVFDQANEILGWDLLQACREGPEDRLKQTDVAQPALFVTGYATAIALGNLGARPDIVAGHSIGEYAALTVAKVFNFAEGLGLVLERARLMKEAATANPGTMAAILGLDSTQVEEVCKAAAARGVCVAVNFNSPEQTVIAGQVEAVAEAGRLASERGAKRVLPLNVSGAFHSPLMSEAAEKMRHVLAKISFQNPKVPVVMNADGQAHTTAEGIRQQLERQLAAPVQWVQTLQSLKDFGVAQYVECGSGRVLTGLLKRIDRKIPAYVTDGYESLQQTAQALAVSSAH